MTTTREPGDRFCLDCQGIIRQDADEVHEGRVWWHVGEPCGDPAECVDPDREVWSLTINGVEYTWDGGDAIKTRGYSLPSLTIGALKLPRDKGAFEATCREVAALRVS